MRSLPLLAVTTALAASPVNVHSFSFSSSTSLLNNVRGGPAALSQQSSFHSISTILEQSATNGRSSDESNYTSSPTSSPSEQRRKILQTALLAPLTLAASQPALASDKPPPIIPLLTTARRLRAVPVFTIVDGNGVPFHTYDKDSAGGFGYFFTSYTSAEYVLDDARKAFAKAKTDEAARGEGGGADRGSIGEDGAGDVPDAWGRAQIVTLPLDVVMQLSVKKSRSMAQNGKGRSFDAYYQVIPETSDLNAALRIESGPRYSERGRVPLFYVDGLTIPSAGASAGTEEGAAANPVYFRVRDLKAEWTKQFPDRELPTVRVRELNETFRAMIRPGGKDESVRNLVFVAIPESVEKARSAGRSYKLGEMILTK